MKRSFRPVPGLKVTVKPWVTVAVVVSCCIAGAWFGAWGVGVALLLWLIATGNVEWR